MGNGENMKTAIVIGMLATVALAVPVDAAGGTPANPSGGCDNNGVIVMQGVGNSYECNSITQICHQGTGAGAGAGAGGPGKNEAGAQASAGTSCNASQDEDPDGEPDPDCEDGDGGGGATANGSAVAVLPAVSTGSDLKATGDDCDDGPDALSAAGTALRGPQG